MKFAYYLTFLFTAAVVHGMLLKALDTPSAVDWVTGGFIAAVVVAYIWLKVSIRSETKKYPSTIRARLSKGFRDGATKG